MTKKMIATHLAVLFLLVGGSELFAQAFFPSAVNGTFQVRFSSNASGVQIAIDGAPAGVIPVTVWVLPGVHKFSFTAPGQPTKTIPYPVESDIDVPFLSSQKFFPLTVSTNAPGAALSVDGVAFAGNTTSISSGAHTLTVSAPGYQPISLPFNQPPSSNTLNVTLTASTFPLTVNTNAPGAVLALDGRVFAGNTTLLSSGNHTLSVSAPGFQSISLPFSQPASPNTLNVTLVGLPATLTLNTDRLFKPGTPYRLYVNNGESRGPVLSLSAGSYLIRIVSDNLSIETTVALATAQNLTLTPSLVWDMR